ncbi:MAG: hypothetical protein NTX45_16990 [Proteobacteria bacterium]|nr:hypothetical protein [Pseudomonadota bacterium]
MIHLREKCRHSGMDAGIQSQGCESAPDSSTGASGMLPSMALDTGIRAGMTKFSALAEESC